MYRLSCCHDMSYWMHPEQEVGHVDDSRNKQKRNQLRNCFFCLAISVTQASSSIDMVASHKVGLLQTLDLR